MKRISMLLTTIVAAMAVAAAFAAASASAGTVLCKQSRATESLCSNENILPTGSFLLAGESLEKESLKISFGAGPGESVLSCNGYILNFTTTKEVGNPLPAVTQGSAGSSFCSGYAAPSCSSVKISSGPSTIESVSEEKSVIKVGTTAEPLTISYVCGGESFGTCTYTAVGPVTLEGFTRFVAEKRMKYSGFYCLSEATLTLKGSFGGHGGGYVNIA